MEFTFYGHACFSLRIGGSRLLFDPFITGNPLAQHIDVDNITADYILVSHGHEDHTADLLQLARSTGAQVISNAEIISWVEKQGIENVHPMNFGTAQFPFGTLTYFQALHSSSFADGTYAGAPGGFIIKSKEESCYYSGDTSLMTDFQLVSHYAKPNVLLLPIGGNFTMNATDVLRATEMIGCNKVVGLHFDTFGYIKIDHQATKKMFDDAGKDLLLPEIGQTYTI